MIPRHLLILFAVVLTTLAVPTSGQPTFGLLPDLSFHFTCKDIAADLLSGDFESFLRSSGFRSINLAKIQAEHGLGIDHFQMEAIDPASHWVTISSSPRHPDAYHLALFSTPPTHHSTTLENSFVEFMTMTLHCDLENLDHHENGVEALEMFQRQFSRVEGLLREANEVNGNGRR